MERISPRPCESKKEESSEELVKVYREKIENFLRTKKDFPLFFPLEEFTGLLLAFERAGGSKDELKNVPEIKEVLKKMLSFEIGHFGNREISDLKTRVIRLKTFGEEFGFTKEDFQEVLKDTINRSVEADRMTKYPSMVKQLKKVLVPTHLSDKSFMDIVLEPFIARVLEEVGLS